MLGRPHIPLRLSDVSGNKITNRYDVANIFNNEFVKHFAPYENSVSKLSNGNHDLPFSVSLEDTYAALWLSLNSAAGPDGIEGSVLRQLASALCLPIYIIFQQSLSQCIFASAWKSADVVPIYKGKGSRNQASSYRPISLSSTIGKILECIVRDQILLCVDASRPLNKSQHCFTNKRSTVTNGIVCENIIAASLNSNEQLDI